MTTLHRTLISFAAFIVTYFLVMQAHRPEVMSPEQGVVVWIVFLMMSVVSIQQWEATYLFSSMSLVYLLMILFKKPVSVEALGAAVTVLLSGAAMNGFSLPKWPEWASLSRLWQGVSHVGGRIDRSRTLGRIRKLAMVREGGENLSDPSLQEFLDAEREVTRIRGFFNGSDPALEKALGATVEQVETLVTDHARLLLRAAHLEGLLTASPKAPLDKEIAKLAADAAATQDAVTRSQLQAAVDMKRKRLEEIEKLEVCLQRVNAQRLQLMETLQGTYNRLNALKFADVQTLNASRDAIDGEVRQFRQDLDQMESHMLSAEELGHRREGPLTNGQ